MTQCCEKQASSPAVAAEFVSAVHSGAGFDIVPSFLSEAEAVGLVNSHVVSGARSPAVPIPPDFDGITASSSHGGSAVGIVDAKAIGPTDTLLVAASDGDPDCVDGPSFTAAGGGQLQQLLAEPHVCDVRCAPLCHNGDVVLGDEQLEQFVALHDDSVSTGLGGANPPSPRSLPGGWAGGSRQPIPLRFVFRTRTRALCQS